MKTSVELDHGQIVTLSNEPLHVTISIDQPLIVHILANPSTGYRWMLSKSQRIKDCLEMINDGEFINESNSQSILPINSLAVGQPKMQEWILRSHCDETFDLQWNNLRPWEKEVLPVQTRQLKVTFQKKIPAR